MVYQQIIADVIESSRVDFEEGGVDEHVLEELRQVCFCLRSLCANANIHVSHLSSLSTFLTECYRDFRTFLHRWTCLGRE